MPERDDRVQTRRNQKAPDKTAAAAALPRSPSGAERDAAAPAVKGDDDKKVYSGPRTGFGNRKTNRRGETER